jgi:hypothetical protein
MPGWMNTTKLSCRQPEEHIYSDFEEGISDGYEDASKCDMKADVLLLRPQVSTASTIRQFKTIYVNEVEDGVSTEWSWKKNHRKSSPPPTVQRSDQRKEVGDVGEDECGTGRRRRSRKGGGGMEVEKSPECSDGGRRGGKGRKNHNHPPQDTGLGPSAWFWCGKNNNEMCSWRDEKKKEEKFYQMGCLFHQHCRYQYLRTQFESGDTTTPYINCMYWEESQYYEIYMYEFIKTQGMQDTRTFSSILRGPRETLV